MQNIADYRDALRYADELRTARHQRNIVGGIAAAGWLLLLIVGASWIAQH